GWRHGPCKARRDASADAARTAIRVLWRGDWNVRRQAGPATENSDAVERGPRGGIHHRNTVGTPSAGYSGDQRRRRGRGPKLAAESLSPADSSAEVERSPGDWQACPAHGQQHRGNRLPPSGGGGGGGGGQGCSRGREPRRSIGYGSDRELGERRDCAWQLRGA